MYPNALIVLAAGAGLAAAKTPTGFTPASSTDLIVTYGKTAAMNGAVVAQNTTATAPTIATTSKLTGSSYAVIMLDLDIPTTTNPHVLLHWMQTDLTPATSQSSLATSNGTSSAFLLANAKNTSALAAYISPGPPAKTPLSHRYTQILIDTSSMKSNGTAVLKAAAATRMGFDITTVLANAGLTNNVVAGNSFNVTNPGPADDSTTSGSGSSTSGSGSSTSGSGSSTSGSGSSTTSTASGVAKATTTSKASASSTSAASAASSSVVTVSGAYSLAPGLGFLALGLVLSGLSLAL